MSSCSHSSSSLRSHHRRCHWSGSPVLKVLFWALMFPILWIGFSIANLIDRKKKMARQAAVTCTVRRHGVASEYFELIGVVRQLLYNCFIPHGTDIVLCRPGLYLHRIDDGLHQFSICQLVNLLEDALGYALEVIDFLSFLILFRLHAHIDEHILLLVPSERHHRNIQRTSVSHLDALDHRVG